LLLVASWRTWQPLDIFVM